MSHSEKIIELIESMSVVELNEVVKAIEEKFGVSAAAGVMVAWGAAASEDTGAAKDTVNIELTEIGQQKISVIKAVKEICDIDLKAAKELVEAAPKVIKENVKIEDAETMKAKLEEAGATISLK